MLKELLIVGCLFGVLFGTLNLLSNMADKKELKEKHECCGHNEDNDGCCGGCNCGCKHDNDGDNN